MRIERGVLVDQRELIKPKRRRSPRSKMQSGRMTVLLLEPVSFSGIEDRKITNLNVH